MAIILHPYGTAWQRPWLHSPGISITMAAVEVVCRHCTIPWALGTAPTHLTTDTALRRLVGKWPALGYDLVPQKVINTRLSVYQSRR